MSSHALRVGIVYDDTIDRPGGIGLYVLTLGDALRRRGHHVEYLLGHTRARNVAGAPTHSLATNVHVRFNGNALSMPAASRRRRLSEVLEQGRFDVLHVQVPYSPLMAGRLLTLADSSCAVVGTYHVSSDRLLARLGARALRVLKRRSIGRLDSLMAVSRTAAEFAQTWSRMPVDAIVPNLLDLDSCRPALSGPCDADVVFVGRLVPRKGVDYLLEAMARLPAHRSGGAVRATILGDGPLRARLERQARRRGLHDTVRFVGEVDEQTKAQALGGAKVACFPSLYGESFGVVLLEALAAGAQAVIAGSNAGYAELLAGRGGLIDPRNTGGFAKRLAELLDDESERVALGASQRQMLGRFDVDVVVEEVLAVYERALAARRPSMRMPRSQEGRLAMA